MQVNLNCAGIITVEDPSCIELCKVCNSQSCQCFVDMVNYCLSNTPPPGYPSGTPYEAPIWKNAVCQDFFSNYGPSAEVDRKLGEICQAKYPTFESLIKGGNATDINLCACHMADSQYDNLKASLLQQFPGFAQFPVDKRCLSSSFKTVSTTRQCAVPSCLNILSFNNNMNIIQTGGDCANITGGNTGDKKYTCNASKQCVDDPNGQYSSLAECQSACGSIPSPPTPQPNNLL